MKIKQDTYRDSAEGLQPGALFHRRANMPMYRKHINVSGATYDDRKNESCKEKTQNRRIDDKTGSQERRANGDVFVCVWEL